MKLTCPIIKPIESTPGVPLILKQFCGQKYILVAQAFPSPVEGSIINNCQHLPMLFPTTDSIPQTTYHYFIFIFLRSIYLNTLKAEDLSSIKPSRSKILEPAKRKKNLL